MTYFDKLEITTSDISLPEGACFECGGEGQVYTSDGMDSELCLMCHGTGDAKDKPTETEPPCPPLVD